jgi:hypothetical protein
VWIGFFSDFCDKYENASGFWTAAILTSEEWVSFVSFVSTSFVSTKRKKSASERCLALALRGF